MALFIIRFIIFSGILYLLYRLLFSRMSFFKLNRGIILSIPVIAVLIPLIAPLFQAPPFAGPILNVVLPEIQINGNLAAEGASTDSSGLLNIAYVIGASVVFIYVIGGILRGWYILRKSVHAFENVHFSEYANGPFAFFRKIVIPSDMIHSERLKTVLAHENAHVEQFHGLDNLYYNLLSALFWFNPFIHLLFKELRQTHECLADESALAGTPRESYANLLLSSSFGRELSFDTANRFFNSSLIKTRITMMYKSKTKQKMKILYLALVPILAGMTIVACEKTDSSVSGTKASDTQNVALQNEDGDVTDVRLQKTESMGFAEADQPPLFPDCDASASREEQLQCFKNGVIQYVIDNFEYPEKAKQEGLEGTIYLKFVINGEGIVQEVEVPRNSFPEDANTDAVAEAQLYAVKLITQMPKLAPALKDGKKVAVEFVLPLNLRLD